jgi:hypothetical protein
VQRVVVLDLGEERAPAVCELLATTAHIVEKSNKKLPAEIALMRADEEI